MPSPYWKIDECSAYFDRMRVRGWCFQASPRIVKVEAVFPEPATVVPLVSFGLSSADVAAAIDPAATHCRFDEWLTLPAEAIGREFSLRFTLEDHAVLVGEGALRNSNDGDPFHACWVHFVEALHQLPSGTVLEIGSRARSAITRRDMVPRQLDYVGLDILPGPNVDLVGDAHELGKLFGSGRFVAAFSFSVFEHLAMPWKVALELNRVLVPGGIVFTQSHQTWPVHEDPWDFWRFSRYSWQTFFNSASGFEVVEAGCGEPARIHALRANPVTRLMPDHPAFLGSSSIVRKISETTLTWPVPLEVVARDMYPKGEMAEPPR
ncbi:MAG: methyltransferase domain-containing protein [Opitutus sp.]|nr:methyltransferase domain-containing protein [Opitutus sp.]